MDSSTLLERFCRWLAHAVAYLLPRGVLYFAVVRVFALTTTGRWSSFEASDLMVGEMQSRLQLILRDGGDVPAEPTCGRCGCTESRACNGGCVWAIGPDPVTNIGICTSCVVPWSWD